MNELLVLNAVDKSFDLPTGERLNILTSIDLTVQTGEIVAIIGRSGSGKSTLLNILGLLEIPTCGEYRCGGLDVSQLNDSKMAKMRGSFFGFIFQQFYLLDRRTALENVAEPLLYGKSGGISDRMSRATELLAQVGLEHRSQSMPHVLSGGEQQRVAIARALARKPNIVLADEPTGALDTSTGEQVMDLLVGLVRAEGVTLVLVTHDSAIAARAGRILLLEHGRLSEHQS